MDTSIIEKTVVVLSFVELENSDDARGIFQGEGGDGGNCPPPELNILVTPIYIYEKKFSLMSGNCIFFKNCSPLKWPQDPPLDDAG